MGFWFARFAIPALQSIWGAFCLVRLGQLFGRGAYKATAPEWDRESSGFALGGFLSSFGLLIVLAMIPIRMR